MHLDHGDLRRGKRLLRETFSCDKSEKSDSSKVPFKTSEEDQEDGEEEDEGSL